MMILYRFRFIIIENIQEMSNLPSSEKMFERNNGKVTHQDQFYPVEMKLCKQLHQYQSQTNTRDR